MNMTINESILAEMVRREVTNYLNENCVDEGGKEIWGYIVRNGEKIAVTAAMASMLGLQAYWQKELNDDFDRQGGYSNVINRQEHRMDSLENAYNQNKTYNMNGINESKLNRIINEAIKRNIK